MEWTIQHSAKGTIWKKHKYVKKSDGRYYYADDVDRENRKKEATKKMHDSISKAQGEWESGKYFIKDPADIKYMPPVYFDKEHPDSYETHHMNELAVKEGLWDGWSNENMQDAVRAYNETKNIDEEQVFADKYRKMGDKVTLKMLNTVPDFKDSVQKGKSMIEKLLDE